MDQLFNSCPATELGRSGRWRWVAEGHCVTTAPTVWQSQYCRREFLAVERDRTRGDSNRIGRQHDVLGQSACIEFVTPWLLDKGDRCRRSKDGGSEVAALCQPFDLSLVTNQYKRPVLPVLRTASPAGCFQNTIDITLIERTIFVVPQGPQPKNPFVEITHINTLVGGTLLRDPTHAGSSLMLRREESTLSDQETLAKGPTREVYVDFLRAFSLVMVVIWHWGFTILLVSAETVAPTNPIGSTRGMWTITWVLQVMPVFFFVGGYTHRLAFDNYKKGTSRRFLRRRTKRLLVPALGLIGIWVSLGFVLRSAIDAEWTWSAVILVLSPLWFLIVFLVLIALAPLAIRAHWRWGEVVLVWLVGLAAVLDVLRFHHKVGWAAWANFLVIWGLAHQFGFFYDRLVAAPRRIGWMFFWGGLFSMTALTNMGLYPRSVVGVPGDTFSNMGPPTLTIVGLILLQIGLVLLARDWVLERLTTSDRWRALFAWVNVHSLPLYLWHSTGMAIAIGLSWVLFGYAAPDQPTGEWWLTRPLWLAAAALSTWPFLIAFKKITTKRTADVTTAELASID